MKVARNEKRKKLRGFSYYKNIASFEVFWRDKNFSKNLLFLGSDYLHAKWKLSSSRILWLRWHPNFHRQGQESHRLVVRWKKLVVVLSSNSFFFCKFTNNNINKCLKSYVILLHRPTTARPTSLWNDSTVHHQLIYPVTPIPYPFAFTGPACPSLPAHRPASFGIWMFKPIFAQERRVAKILQPGCYIPLTLWIVTIRSSVYGIESSFMGDFHSKNLPSILISFP